MTHVANPDQLLEKLATDLENLTEQRHITDPLWWEYTGGAWLAEITSQKTEYPATPGLS